MRGGKQIVIVNIAATLGIATSLFIVPGNTPLWVWAVIAIGFLIVTNVVLLVRPAESIAESNRATRTIIITLGAAILIIDILVTKFLR